MAPHQRAQALGHMCTQDAFEGHAGTQEWYRAQAGVLTGSPPAAPQAPALSHSGARVALSLILLAMVSILSAALAPVRLGASVAPMASILLVSAPSLAALRGRLA